MRRVEVKGTTGPGTSVIVTIGEVKSARAYTTDLFIVSEIDLAGTKAKGGRTTIISPWRPAARQLNPKVLEYVIPDDVG